MGLKVDVKSWRVEVSEDEKTKGEKRIAGTYRVMSGATEVAKQSFNGGYGSVSVPMPPELLAKAMALDEEIRAAVANHYGIGE
jgi:hypothetical protein